MLITDSCAGLLSSFKLNNPAPCCGPWRLWAQGVRRCHCPPCSAFPVSQARGLASPPAPKPPAETPETIAVLGVSLFVLRNSCVSRIFKTTGADLTSPFSLVGSVQCPCGGAPDPCHPGLLDSASR